MTEEARTVAIIATLPSSASRNDLPQHHSPCCSLATLKSSLLRWQAVLTCPQCHTSVSSMHDFYLQEDETHYMCASCFGVNDDTRMMNIDPSSSSSPDAGIIIWLIQQLIAAQEEQENAVPPPVEASAASFASPSQKPSHRSSTSAPSTATPRRDWLPSPTMMMIPPQQRQQQQTIHYESLDPDTFFGKSPERDQQTFSSSLQIRYSRQGPPVPLERCPTRRDFLQSHFHYNKKACTAPPPSWTVFDFDEEEPGSRSRDEKGGEDDPILQSTTTSTTSSTTTPPGQGDDIQIHNETNEISGSTNQLLLTGVKSKPATMEDQSAIRPLDSSASTTTATTKEASTITTATRTPPLPIAALAEDDDDNPWKRSQSRSRRRKKKAARRPNAAKPSNPTSSDATTTHDQKTTTPTSMAMPLRLVETQELEEILPSSRQEVMVVNETQEKEDASCSPGTSVSLPHTEDFERIFPKPRQEEQDETQEEEAYHRALLSLPQTEDFQRIFPEPPPRSEEDEKGSSEEESPLQDQDALLSRQSESTFNDRAKRKSSNDSAGDDPTKYSPAERNDGTLSSSQNALMNSMSLPETADFERIFPGPQDEEDLTNVEDDQRGALEMASAESSQHIDHNQTIISENQPPDRDPNDAIADNSKDTAKRMSSLQQIGNSKPTILHKRSSSLPSSLSQEDIRRENSSDESFAVFEELSPLTQSLASMNFGRPVVPRSSQNSQESTPSQEMKHPVVTPAAAANGSGKRGHGGNNVLRTLLDGSHSITPLVGSRGKVVDSPVLNGNVEKFEQFNDSRPLVDPPKQNQRQTSFSSPCNQVAEFPYRTVSHPFDETKTVNICPRTYHYLSALNSASRIVGENGACLWGDDQLYHQAKNHRPEWLIQAPWWNSLAKSPCNTTSSTGGIRASMLLGYECLVISKSIDLTSVMANDMDLSGLEVDRCGADVGFRSLSSQEIETLGSDAGMRMVTSLTQISQLEGYSVVLVPEEIDGQTFHTKIWPFLVLRGFTEQDWRPHVVYYSWLVDCIAAGVPAPLAKYIVT